MVVVTIPVLWASSFTWPVEVVVDADKLTIVGFVSHVAWVKSVYATYVRSLVFPSKMPFGDKKKTVQVRGCLTRQLNN